MLCALAVALLAATSGSAWAASKEAASATTSGSAAAVQSSAGHPNALQSGAAHTNSASLNPLNPPISAQQAQNALDLLRAQMLLAQLNPLGLGGLLGLFGQSTGLGLGLGLPTGLFQQPLLPAGLAQQQRPAALPNLSPSSAPTLPTAEVIREGTISPARDRIFQGGRWLPLKEGSCPDCDTKFLYAVQPGVNAVQCVGCPREIFFAPDQIAAALNQLGQPTPAAAQSEPAATAKRKRAQAHSASVAGDEDDDSLFTPSADGDSLTFEDHRSQSPEREMSNTPGVKRIRFDPELVVEWPDGNSSIIMGFQVAKKTRAELEAILKSAENCYVQKFNGAFAAQIEQLRAVLDARQRGEQTEELSEPQKGRTRERSSSRPAKRSKVTPAAAKRPERQQTQPAAQSVASDAEGDTEADAEVAGITDDGSPPLSSPPLSSPAQASTGTSHSERQTPLPVSALMLPAPARASERANSPALRVKIEGADSAADAELSDRESQHETSDVITFGQPIVFEHARIHKVRLSALTRDRLQALYEAVDAQQKLEGGALRAISAEIRKRRELERAKNTQIKKGNSAIPTSGAMDESKALSLPPDGRT